MGMDPLTITAGASALGSIAGAAKGSKGTPGQSETMQKMIPIAGAQEKDLQRQSLDQYQKAQELASQYEQQITGAQGLQEQARQAASRIMGGEAFNITPQEQAQIEAIRQATVQAGSGDIQDFLNRQMSQVVASGAGRGLRGQALGGLQGQVIDTGARQFGNLASQAQLTAAQQAFQAPYQRLQAQSPYIQGGLSFADQMRLQAQQNRNLLQSPWMLQAFQQERIAGAPTRQSSPGQGGGLVDALFGGLLGGASGATAGANIYSGIENLKKAGGK